VGGTPSGRGARVGLLTTGTDFEVR
jgi:hypothetical protein